MALSAKDFKVLSFCSLFPAPQLSSLSSPITAQSEPKTEHGQTASLPKTESMSIIQILRLNIQIILTRVYFINKLEGWTRA